MLVPSAGPRLVVAEVEAAEVVALGGATRVHGSPCQSLMQEVTGFEQCLPAGVIQISLALLRWPGVWDVNVADLSRHCKNGMNICLPCVKRPWLLGGTLRPQHHMCACVAYMMSKQVALAFMTCTAIMHASTNIHLVHDDYNGQADQQKR